MKIDGSNKQAVALRGKEVLVMVPKTVMSADEAMVHAAYLEAMALAAGASFTFSEARNALG